MKLDHPALVDLLRLAYSAEKAAAFAYIGHAGSLKNTEHKIAVKQIEDDEWEHRVQVLRIMQQYNVPISKYYECKYYIIGKVIGYSCYVIGRFMPHFFAGRLEGRNVCEYFKMIAYFNSLGIDEHDDELFAMGIKEKEHEDFFLDAIKDDRWLPFFTKVFSWGKNRSANNVNMKKSPTLKDIHALCAYDEKNT